MTSDQTSLTMRSTPEGVRFEVRVTPRAGRTAIAGIRDGRLSVRVAAAPVDGEANAALTRAIAEACDVAPRRVRIILGERGRTKTIEVQGLDAATVRRQIAGAIA